MDVLLKVAGGKINTWHLLLLRWVFALVILLPVFLSTTAGSLRMVSPGVHIARGVLNCIGSYALFYALANLPLSVVITILFAEPIVVIPIAWVLLQEKLKPKDVVAAALGLVGVAIICRPDLAQGEWKMVFPLIAAGSFAMVGILFVPVHVTSLRFKYRF